MNNRVKLDNACPLVSGNWNETNNAGLWYINLNEYRTNSNNNVSGRS